MVDKKSPHNKSMSHLSFSLTVMFFTFWVLMLSICIGKTGLSNYGKLAHLRDELIEANIKLQVQNQALLRQQDRLKNVRKEKEAYLASEYGYIKKESYVYRFEAVPTQYDFRRMTAKTLDTEHAGKKN